MKCFVSRGVCITLFLPALAGAADPQTVPEPAPQAMVSMPMSLVEPETREMPRLRDSLRQPYGDEVEPNKPYRLSAEERQRLREQLRGGSTLMQSRK